MTTQMFEELGRRREANAALRMRALSDELARLERQIDDHVERLVATNLPVVSRALEEKIRKLETERLVVAEKNCRRGVPRQKLRRPI